MAEFINLTPHAVVIRAQDGRMVTFPPSGEVARLATSVERVRLLIVNTDDPSEFRARRYSRESADGYRAGGRVLDEGVDTRARIVVNRTKLGAVEGLPAPEFPKMYIVSRLVLDACPDRDDLVAPGAAIRDDAGRVIGAEGFAV